MTEPQIFCYGQNIDYVRAAVARLHSLEIARVVGAMFGGPKDD